MVTIDTNIAIYALEAGSKADVAEAVLQKADFASNQVAYEYANVKRRKFKRPWQEIEQDIGVLQRTVPVWYAVERDDPRAAILLAERYQLQFYDALMIAVGLAHGATTLFSEEMQHGLLIEDRLRIENPFL